MPIKKKIKKIKKIKKKKMKDVLKLETRKEDSTLEQDCKSLFDFAQSAFFANYCAVAVIRQ